MAVRGRPAATTFYLVRHGATAWNEARRWAGRAEMPLAELGRLQIDRLAVRLAAEPPFARIYASPLGRSRESAAILDHAVRVGISEDARLTEISYGEWEGRTPAEVTATAEGKAWYERWERNPAEVTAPGGESAGAVHARARACLGELADRHPGARLILVGHRSTNRILIAGALGLPLEEFRRAVPQDSGALSFLVLDEDGTLRALVVNDTAHLAGLPRAE